MLVEKFAITDLGDVLKVVAIGVKRDKVVGTIELGQAQHILSLLTRFNMSDCDPVHVFGIGKEPSAQPKGSKLLKETTTKLYQAIVESHIFFAQCMGYDVAVGTMQATYHMTWPSSYRYTWQRSNRYFDTCGEHLTWLQKEQ